MEKFENEFERLVRKEIQKIQELISEEAYEKAEALIRNSLFLSPEQKQGLLNEVKSAKELNTADQLEIVIKQNEELKNQLLELSNDNIELKRSLADLEIKLSSLEKKYEVIERKSTKWTHLGNFIGLMGLIITLAPIIKNVSLDTFKKTVKMILEIISKVIEHLR